MDETTEAKAQHVPRRRQWWPFAAACASAISICLVSILSDARSTLVMPETLPAFRRTMVVHSSVMGVLGVLAVGFSGIAFLRQTLSESIYCLVPLLCGCWAIHEGVGWLLTKW